MKFQELHPWDVTPKEAISIQRDLADRLLFPPFKKSVTYVAGADVSFSKNDPRIYAAVVVLKLPDLETVEVAAAVDLASFPYIPGLLSFRELPILSKAFEKLIHVPDVVLCDGQGKAHPRGIGIACHLGLLLNLPAIGCAKSRLIGDYEKVDENKWSQSVLTYKEKTVGAVLRTRKGVKPMFISAGHLIDLKASIEIVKQCAGRYRLPEPTRRAHIAVNELRIQVESQL